MGFIELYEARLRLDIKRQYSCSDDLRQLDKRLKLLGRTHPYDLPTDLSHTLAVPFIGKPGRAEVDGFIYRLNGLTSLLRRKEGIELLGSKRPPSHIFVEMLAAHRAQLATSSHKGGWLRLGDFVKGRLRRTQAVDFWTELPLSHANLREDTYRIGLPRDYHPEDPLILRCNVGDLANGSHAIKLPTALDGYCHGPFFSTAEHLDPSAGHTLNLNHPDSLEKGVAEYVTNDVPVDLIMFMPVAWKLRPDPTRRFTDNKLLAAQMANFFNKQT